MSRQTRMQIATMLLLAGVTACAPVATVPSTTAPAGQPTDAAATQPPATDVTLTVWFMGADIPAQKEFSETAARKFEEKTGIKIVTETVSPGDRPETWPGGSRANGELSK